MIHSRFQEISAEEIQNILRSVELRSVDKMKVSNFLQKCRSLNVLEIKINEKRDALRRIEKKSLKCLTIQFDKCDTGGECCLDNDYYGMKKNLFCIRFHRNKLRFSELEIFESEFCQTETKSIRQEINKMEEKLVSGKKTLMRLRENIGVEIDPKYIEMSDKFLSNPKFCFGVENAKVSTDTFGKQFDNLIDELSQQYFFVDIKDEIFKGDFVEEDFDLIPLIKNYLDLSGNKKILFNFNKNSYNCLNINVPEQVSNHKFLIFYDFLELEKDYLEEIKKTYESYLSKRGHGFSVTYVKPQKLKLNQFRKINLSLLTRCSSDNENNTYLEVLSYSEEFSYEFYNIDEERGRNLRIGSLEIYSNTINKIILGDNTFNIIKELLHEIFTVFN